jgi:hypothetical protein
LLTVPIPFLQEVRARVGKAQRCIKGARQNVRKARERAAKMCRHAGKTRACASKMSERVGLSRVPRVAMPSCDWKTSCFFAKMLQPDRKQGANAKGGRHFSLSRTRLLKEDARFGARAALLRLFGGPVCSKESPLPRRAASLVRSGARLALSDSREGRKDG